MDQIGARGGGEAYFPCVDVLKNRADLRITDSIGFAQLHIKKVNSFTILLVY